MRAEKSNAPLEAFIKVTFEWLLGVRAEKPVSVGMRGDCSLH
jgi:hypothetical protein